MSMTGAQFEEQAPRQRELLRRWIAARGFQDADVEDILQNTFATAHAKLPQLRDARKLQAWMRKIARQFLRECYDKRQPRQWAESMAAGAAKRADRNLLDEFDAVIGLVSPAETNPAVRLTGLLFYCLNWPARDIAVFQQVKPFTVYQRLARLKSKLRAGARAAAAPESMAGLKLDCLELLFHSGHASIRGSMVRNLEIMREAHALLQLANARHPRHPGMLSGLSYQSFILASMAEYDPEYPNFLRPDEWRRDAWDPELRRAGERYYREFLSAGPDAFQAMAAECTYRVYAPLTHATVDWARIRDINLEILRRWPRRRVLRQLGMCHLYIDGPLAAARFLESFRRHPAARMSRGFLSDLADYYFFAGRWRKAAQFYRQYLRRFPAADSVKSVIRDRIGECQNNIRHGIPAAAHPLLSFETS